MTKREPPLLGGDPTAAHEIEPSAAVCNGPQTQSEIAHAHLTPTFSYQSNEDGFAVTVTLVGEPDDTARRRWISRTLSGRQTVTA